MIDAIDVDTILVIAKVSDFDMSGVVNVNTRTHTCTHTCICTVCTYIHKHMNSYT